MGLVIANELTIVRPLAEGGMGAVYVATQKSTGKERALKLMHREIAADPGFQRRFEQEAQVGSRIQSDHIVEVLGAGVDEKSGLPYLVMELLEGEDLRSRMLHGPLSVEDTRVVLEQLCHAMIAAHAAGVVHRDLKPENIFLARSRRAGGDPFMVKVLDFGIAKLVLESNTRSTRGSIGSPLWMAPEQTSPGPVTSAADVWSIALLTYEMLVGKSYWRTANLDGGNTLQLLREIVLEPLPAASARASEIEPARHLADRLPPGFDAWFEHALAREPAQRFQDASAMARALPPMLAPRSLSLSKVSVVPSTMTSALAETHVAVPLAATEVGLGDTGQATPFELNAAAPNAVSAPPFRVHDPPPLATRIPPETPLVASHDSKVPPAAAPPKTDRRVVVLAAIAVIAVAVAIGSVAGSMHTPPAAVTAASPSASAPIAIASASAPSVIASSVAAIASDPLPIASAAPRSSAKAHATSSSSAQAAVALVEPSSSSSSSTPKPRAAPGGFSDPYSEHGGAVTWKVQETRVRLFTRLQSNESNVADAVVRKAMEWSSWQYLRCYERVFGGAKDLPEGTVAVGFDILDQLPRHAKLASSTFSSAAFNDCVVGTLVGQTINAAGPDGKGHAVIAFRFLPN